MDFFLSFFLDLLLSVFVESVVGKAERERDNPLSFLVLTKVGANCVFYFFNFVYAWSYHRLERVKYKSVRGHPRTGKVPYEDAKKIEKSVKKKKKN
jgi:hypothetical protein